MKNLLLGLAALLVFTLNQNQAHAQWFSVNYGSTDQIHSMQFISATQGYLYLDHSVISTTDGGQSWTTIATNPFDLGPFDGYFFNSNQGVLVGAGIDQLPLYSSTGDGGANWNLNILQGMFLPGTDYSPKRVVFNTQNHGFIIGKQGRMFETFDQGLNWQLPAWITNDEFSSIQFPTAQVGYLSMLNGPYLYKTTDGGATWNSIAYGNYTAVNDVHFINAQQGFLVGPSGMLKQSQDGGVTWTDIVIPTTEDLNAIAFKNQNEGVIVGKNGAILTTQNGGVTWSPENSGTTKELKRIAFPSQTLTMISGGDVEGILLSNIAILTSAESDTATSLSMQLYPNPSHDYLQITSMINSNHQVRIIDMQGKIVLQQTSRESSLQVPVAHIPSGRYIVQSVSEKNKHTQVEEHSIVIQH